MHTRKHTGGPRRRNSKAILILALVLIFALAIGGTVAWLTTQTQDVPNTFTPEEFGGEIVEKFDGEQKTSIQVQNTGNVPIRVRVVLAVNWINEEGDYCTEHVSNIAIPYDATNWTESGGVYTYNGVLQKKGDLTPNLLTAPIELAEGEDGCKMQVEVLASVIQANATGAW